MPATGADIDQLVDSAAGRDDEVGTDVRQFVKLRVGYIRRKRVEHAGHSRSLSDMLDDYVGVPQSPLRLSVVAL